MEVRTARRSCCLSIWSLKTRGETKLSLLAECFAQLDGAPTVVLSDRLACLKTGVVLPHPKYVCSPSSRGS